MESTFSLIFNLILVNFYDHSNQFYCNVIGTAYIHGLQFATGDFIIIMDADLSHHVI